MKKLIYTFLAVSIIFSACEEEDVVPANTNNNNTGNNTYSGPKTYVPDDGFEQYLIDAGYDDVIDDSVLTANINTIGSFSITPNTVSDLTGIEDFTALYNLYCPDNQVTYLDLSNNTALHTINIRDNNLYYLDLRNGRSQNGGVPMNVIAAFNQNLTCVSVDDVAWANQWFLEANQGVYYFYPEPIFSTNCN